MKKKKIKPNQSNITTGDFKEKRRNNNKSHDKSKQANKAMITQKTRYDKVQVYKYMKIYLRGISDKI